LTGADKRAVRIPRKGSILFVAAKKAVEQQRGGNHDDIYSPKGRWIMKLTFISMCLLITISMSAFGGGGSMLLTVGQKAPDFSLVSSNRDTVRLSQFKGHSNVVLIFYPGDETPGCTKQLCAVRDDYAQFKAKNVMVFGVNPANVESHKKFIERQGYQFPLLVDEGQQTAKLYGCESWPTVKRTVYAIDMRGVIVFVKQGMPSDEEVLKSIPEQKEIK
jgi:peroxiredoxin Q/BCP